MLYKDITLETFLEKHKFEPSQYQLLKPENTKMIYLVVVARENYYKCIII